MGVRYARIRKIMIRDPNYKAPNRVPNFMNLVGKAFEVHRSTRSVGPGRRDSVGSVLARLSITEHPSPALAPTLLASKDHDGVEVKDGGSGSGFELFNGGDRSSSVGQDSK